MDLKVAPILMALSVVSAGLSVILCHEEIPELLSPVMEDDPSSYAFLEWQDKASWGPWGLEVSDVDLNGAQEILVGSSGQTTWDFRIYNGSSHEHLLDTYVNVNRWHHTVSAGNVNDDPLEEIIIPSWNPNYLEDNILIMQWDGSSLTQIWASGNSIPTTLVTEVFDVDGDGRQEIFTLSEEWDYQGDYPIGHLFEIDFNSSSGVFDVRDRLSFPRERLTWIKFYDIDEDGVQEIVLRSMFGIYAYDSKSMELDWSLNDSELSGIGDDKGMDVGDPDGDGQVEIVVSGYFQGGWRIAWIDVQTKSIERITPLDFMWLSERLMIHDVDQDSVAEIVAPIVLDSVNRSGGYLVILDGRTGAVEFRSRDFGDSVWVAYCLCSLEVANVDTDPEIEILVSNYLNIYQYQVNISEPVGPIEVDLDCDPDTLNLKSKGHWITCYIELPSGYDPRDINASTILLNDALSPELDPKYGFVKSEESYIVDHDADGILERMVKFNRSEVEDLVSVGNAVSLCVTGKLEDGRRFEGSDTIRVINPP